MRLDLDQAFVDLDYLVLLRQHGATQLPSHQPTLGPKLAHTTICMTARGEIHQLTSRVVMIRQFSDSTVQCY
jgi:hypothetical protein